MRRRTSAAAMRGLCGSDASRARPRRWSECRMPGLSTRAGPVRANEETDYPMSNSFRRFGTARLHRVARLERGRNIEIRRSRRDNTCHTPARTHRRRCAVCRREVAFARIVCTPHVRHRFPQMIDLALGSRVRDGRRKPSKPLVEHHRTGAPCETSSLLNISLLRRSGFCVRDH